MNLKTKRAIKKYHVRRWCIRTSRALSLKRGGYYQARYDSPILHVYYMWAWVSKHGCRLQSLKQRMKRKTTVRQRVLAKSQRILTKKGKR